MSRRHGQQRIGQRKGRTLRHGAAQARREGAPQVAKDPSPLYARNWLFIEPDVQAKLADVVLMTAGTGLGSVIALLAARTGFQRFLLADGDTVNLSNLNRQVFTRKQIGQNKAVVTARLIRRLVPTAAIEVVPRFLTTSDVAPLIDRAGLIINTISLDHPAFLGVNRVAAARGKPVLFPLNIGWAGCLLVFLPAGGSVTLDAFIAGTNDTNDTAEADALASADSEQSVAQLQTRLIEQILRQVPGGIPPYIQRLLPQFQLRDQQSWPYDPQLGVAAQVTAALTVSAAVALVAGKPVRVAPEVIWLDTYLAVSPDPVGGPRLAPARDQQDPNSGAGSASEDTPATDQNRPLHGMGEKRVTGETGETGESEDASGT